MQADVAFTTWVVPLTLLKNGGMFGGIDHIGCDLSLNGTGSPENNTSTIWDNWTTFSHPRWLCPTENLRSFLDVYTRSDFTGK